MHEEIKSGYNHQHERTSVTTAPRVQRLESTTNRSNILNNDFLLSLSEAKNKADKNETVLASSSFPVKGETKDNDDDINGETKKEKRQVPQGMGLDKIPSQMLKQVSNHTSTTMSSNRNAFLQNTVLQDEQNEKEKKASTIEPSGNDNHLDTEDVIIPTLDTMISIDDIHMEERFDDVQRQELPSLKELDFKSNHTIKKSRDGIDLSVLINNLIPEEEVIKEKDEIWTNDFLLQQVSNYFNQERIKKRKNTPTQPLN